MAQKGRGKRAKLPFWKRYGAEIEHITDHIGRAFDNAKPRDWAEAILMGGIAFLGYRALKGKPEGAVTALLGYKLAQTDGLISQGAGVGILGTLGLISILPASLGDLPEEDLKERGEWIEGTYGIHPYGTCPTGYRKETFGYRNLAWCVPISRETGTTPSPEPTYVGPGMNDR